MCLAGFWRFVVAAWSGVSVDWNAGCEQRWRVELRELGTRGGRGECCCGVFGTVS